MINPVSSSTLPQAPTQATPTPPQKAAPYTVQDRVTLSSAGDVDHDGDSK